MSSFKERIKTLSKEKSPLILANDYDDQKNLESKTLANIKTLHKYLCAVKLNFHLLLPLGKGQISKINKTAHDSGLQTIADIKLNDIGNTNFVTAQALWDMGFDAIIVNPIMGPQSLQNLIKLAHKNKKGVISLCHMSAPEARVTYELKVSAQSKTAHLYQMFLRWASELNADGIIVGATFPQIIRYCKQQSKGNLSIYSPGIGAQEGDIQSTMASGSDYLIVGRAILNSKSPKQTSQSLFELARKN